MYEGIRLFLRVVETPSSSSSGTAYVLLLSLALLSAVPRLNEQCVQGPVVEVNQRQQSLLVDGGASTSLKNKFIIEQVNEQKKNCAFEEMSSSAVSAEPLPASISSFTACVWILAFVPRVQYVHPYSTGL